jgi:hypothetical protein
MLALVTSKLFCQLLVVEAKVLEHAMIALEPLEQIRKLISLSYLPDDRAGNAVEPRRHVSLLRWKKAHARPIGVLSSNDYKDLSRNLRLSFAAQQTSLDRAPRF